MITIGAEEPLLKVSGTSALNKEMKRSPRLAPFLRCVIVIFVIFVIFVVLRTVPEFNQYRLVKSYGVESQDDKIKKTRTILLWNSFFEKKTWSLPADTIGPGVLLDNLKCPEYNCEITNNHDFLPSIELYDAIVFHTAEPFPLFNSVPRRRNPEQVYVFAQMEPPGETKHVLNDEGDFYNWTMTYRLDSDIIWPYQYIEEISTGRKVAPAKFPAWRTPPSNFNDSTVWSLWKNKTNTAAWFVSHCNTLSKREEVVASLQQYIDVDIFGKCGPKKCKRFSEECDLMLDQKYKFYLSFENSLCTDYVTEKLYTALQRQIVPIVYGGADYTRFLPPNSYINSEHFKTIKELASYLDYLSSNPEEYMRYFWWRQHYKLSKNSSPFCDICEKLHSVSYLYKKQSYTNIQDWWLNGSCRFETKYIKDRL